MLRTPNVLLLCSDEVHTAAFQYLLAPHAVVVLACDLPQAVKLLERSSYDAFLCAWRFDFGTWNDALLAVRRLRPDLPVIIFSAVAGESEWAEVLDAGAFDLLVPPFTHRSVLPSLEHALASHEARILRQEASGKKRNQREILLVSSSAAGDRS